MLRAAAVAVLLVLPAEALAHGPVHEQIEAVTRQIEADPANTSLYLKRAELHRVHRDWPAAFKDYDQVSQLEPAHDLVEFYRGRALEEADRAAEAKAALDRFLAKRPADGEALLARARALVKLGERAAAARDFDAALARLARPNPEVYIERARALAADGRADEALRGLDEGIERLGPLVTLELPAIELELAAKRDDAALARVELLAAQSRRKEQCLARRGDILARAGRRAEAKEAFAAALAAIESLKGSQRGVRATAELEARLRAALAEVSISPSGRQ